MSKKISQGVVHKVPLDLKKVLMSDSVMLEKWNDITPLARNEFICWITSCKKEETRKKRIEVAKSKLKSGERRPCCFEGCSHRGKEAKL